jgi:hypothetical protein
MANIQLDFEQLDIWPPYWRCKECGDPTNLLVIEERGHRLFIRKIYKESSALYSLKYLKR